MRIKQVDETPSQTMLAEVLMLKGYHKTRIAKEANISRRSLNNIISGDTLSPNHKTFRKLLTLYCRLFFSTGVYRIDQTKDIKGG